MKAVFAEVIVALHDRAWRERFGDECRALLEELPLSVEVVASMTGSAIVSRRRLLLHGITTAVIVSLLAFSATLAFQHDDPQQQAGIATAPRAMMSARPN
jgi:hypothetical protein